MATIVLDKLYYAPITESATTGEETYGTPVMLAKAISAELSVELAEATVDQNGVLISTTEDGGTPVAIGFRDRKSNGKYKYLWIYRVKFAVPSTSLATIGDDITFSTPTIEGTVMRRNKLDASYKHPWKAEVDENDTGVEQSTINAWYTSVYEPDFTAD